MKNISLKIFEELNKLNESPQINRNTLKKFIIRLNEGEPFTKPQNPTSHFCVLFIPFNKETNSVYIGHHIKTNFWIPPGGHMNFAESPIEAVIREFNEELSFTITNEKIELININLTFCVPGVICKKHYDFFYLVYLNNMHKFNFSKSEFFDAKWMPLKEAVDIITFPDFKRILINLI